MCTLHKGSTVVTSLSGCQIEYSKEMWDTMAPSWDGWLWVAIKCSFTGREAKEYLCEQGL